MAGPAPLRKLSDLPPDLPREFKSLRDQFLKPLECIVTLEPVTDFALFPCGHSIGAENVPKLFVGVDAGHSCSCPICRKPANREQIIPNFVLNHVAVEYVKLVDICLRLRQKLGDLPGQLHDANEEKDRLEERLHKLEAEIQSQRERIIVLENVDRQKNEQIQRLTSQRDRLEEKLRSEKRKDHDEKTVLTEANQTLLEENQALQRQIQRKEKRLQIAYCVIFVLGFALIALVPFLFPVALLKRKPQVSLGNDVLVDRTAKISATQAEVKSSKPSTDLYGSTAIAIYRDPTFPNSQSLWSSFRHSTHPILEHKVAESASFLIKNIDTLSDFKATQIWCELIISLKGRQYGQCVLTRSKDIEKCNDFLMNVNNCGKCLLITAADKNLFQEEFPEYLNELSINEFQTAEDGKYHVAIFVSKYDGYFFVPKNYVNILCTLLGECKTLQDFSDLNLEPDYILDFVFDKMKERCLQLGVLR